MTDTADAVCRAAESTRGRRDIVDAIDELVDWQLQKTPSGYDHNINQEKCPHPWCDADWHGLAITARMRAMRRAGYVDPDYRYAADDSEILCPGSDFVGEFTPPAPEPPTPYVPGPTEAIRAAQLLWGDVLAAATGLPSSLRQLADAIAYHSPAQHLPLLSAQDVRRLESMRASWSVSREMFEYVGENASMGLADGFVRRAEQEFGRGVVDRSDVDVRWSEEEDPRGRYVRFVAAWRPRTLEVELDGGPHHGHTVTVGTLGASVCMPRRYRPSVDDYRRMPSPDEFSPIEYRLDGWNPNTRRWIYRTHPREQAA
ncbi:hypothetical protein [Nocardia farcinica]|uniref:hypothetical protein n=1 Tax=Nocardia farcinica TaxID=37329 RepID=UPI002458B6A9|nr:hypothetical protein [Nocardia farcinica]